MAGQYSIEVLKIVVAQICQTIGWHAIQSTPLNIMVDILHKYIIELGKNAHSYAEHFGHTSPNLDDIGLAFRDAGVLVEDLSEYIGNVEAVQFPHAVPKYPVPRESHLNFLKPGSREVLTRPVHVHEHLPPMHPQLEEEEKAVVLAALSVDTSGGGAEVPSPASPKGTASGGFKRPGEAEHHSAKRARLMMEEEGRPVREISSVMMTTSGFLSPAREGKLPEARTPAGADPASRSASPSPSPSCYPTVPPDVKGDKKPKKPVIKKPQNEFDKEATAPKKKEARSGCTPEKTEEPKVKKLVSMKEFAKLKALKAGAMKQMAAIVPPVNLGGLGKIPKIGASRPSEVKSPKNKIGPTSPKSSAPEKAREVGLIEGKLSSEPDKQKLNIFKKISKVKEDKADMGETIAEAVASRESSPGLVIDESELSGRRDSRMAKIETSIDAVVQAAADSKSPVSESESDRESPGPNRERDQESASPAPEPRRKERKKKRDRSKSKRGTEIEAAPPVSRPKTPEASDVSRPPVFPFFTHYPPAPGLIPPPIGHPFFPRFPMPLGKNMPHPVMPSLPMPPARLMHRPVTPPMAAPEVGTPITPTPPSPAAGDSSREGEKLTAKLSEKSPEKPPDKTPEKVPEKKIKEHKKEKKEKDKTKKKKDKKDKLKGKERGEKKKTKEEKREKNKSKEKKEKKEKRKEKERDEKMEGSVPKITLRISASSPRPPTPECPVPVRRILPNKVLDEELNSTIKPVVKTVESGHENSTSASSEMVIVTGTRDPSPELARMCALVTRPAKKSSKSGQLSDASSGVGLDRRGSIGTSVLSSEPTLAPALTQRSHGPPAIGSRHDRGFPGAIGGADNSGNKVWICPACGGQDDGSPMIGCDDCDAWYHWVCVGIQVPPDENEDWYCRVCIVKKQEHVSDRSKKKRKKKLMAP